MSKNFYNTINLSGTELKTADSKAKGLQEQIRDFLHENHNQEFTPVEIHDIMRFKCPITSTRRALTNLSNEVDSCITKTEIMRQGAYNMPNHTWKYNPPQKREFKQMDLF